jgi:hypothetical protein
MTQTRPLTRNPKGETKHWTTAAAVTNERTRARTHEVIWAFVDTGPVWDGERIGELTLRGLAGC